MTQLRIVLAAVAASLALGIVGVPVAGASNGTTVPPKVTKIPALDTVPVTGTAKGGKRFTGRYAIQRFLVHNGKVVAYGTLTGRLKGRQVKRYGVMIPVDTSSLGAPGGARAAATCPVLDLRLQPIDLNLLGLRVHLDTVHLAVDAQSGSGNLLGNLLCGVVGLLDQNPLSGLVGNLQQLSAALNSIVSLLGGVQATQP